MKTIRLIMKLAALALLVLALITNNFLPITYLIGIGVVLVVLLLICWNRKVLQIVVVILILLISGGLMYAENVASRLINYNPNQVNAISFFVLKDSKITTIKKAIDKNISTSSIAEEETTSLIQTKLEEKGYTKKISLFQGIQDGIQELYDGKIDVLVIDQAYLSSIAELDPEFTNKTKVIWSFENTTSANSASNAVKVTTEPFIVFLSGIDIEGPISTVSRSDVNIIMVVNPKINSIQTISIPRDAYVGLGCKKGAPLDKLTHAGIYGIGCSVSTIEKLLGITINYYARFNFSSVKDIIYTLGSVQVNNPIEFTSWKWHYPKGLITLDYESALQFARERHSFEDGDIQRGKNQQELIRAVISKMLEPKTLTKIEDLVKVAQNRVDTNMTGKEILSLVRKQIQNNKPWATSSFAMDGVGDYQPTYSMGSQLLYVTKLAPKSIATAKELIKNLMSATAESTATP